MRKSIGDTMKTIDEKRWKSTTAYLGGRFVLPDELAIIPVLIASSFGIVDLMDFYEITSFRYSNIYALFELVDFTRNEGVDNFNALLELFPEEAE